MISSKQSFNTPIRVLLILTAIILLQLSVPSTEVHSFSITSEETRLVKPVEVYKSFVSIMASARTELEEYKKATESIIKQTEEAVKTWKIVKVESKKNHSNTVLWPVRGVITSKFGMRVHPVTGNRSFHNGIDIRGKSGTKVLCPTDGIVVDSGWSGALGRMVKVKTSSGHTLCFGHLSKIICKKGQTLSRGQILGTVGCSGRATGPHLHFTVYYRGNYMNPIKYLSK
ncbi:MAG: M23 family metallopeptidase [Candidatus Riflebacteria bacterium]|jgi:murein DD-endopeptidase MepM/ murein hydrolase activator NlpD|nr:M23 family metallopeptidase [Candidatus Riflebacteria bacterium]